MNKTSIVLFAIAAISFSATAKAEPSHRNIVEIVVSDDDSTDSGSKSNAAPATSSKRNSIPRSTIKGSKYAPRNDTSDLGNIKISQIGVDRPEAIALN